MPDAVAIREGRYSWPMKVVSPKPLTIKAPASVTATTAIAPSPNAKTTRRPGVSARLPASTSLSP
jgi:hypothetical protein